VKPLPPAELVPEVPALLPEATVDSDDEDFESFLAEDSTGPPPLPAPETYSAITPRGGPLAAVPELPEPAEASELPAPVVPKPATPSLPARDAAAPSLPARDAAMPALPARDAATPSLPARDAAAPSLPARDAAMPALPARDHPPVKDALPPSTNNKRALPPPPAIGGAGGAGVEGSSMDGYAPAGEVPGVLGGAGTDGGGAGSVAGVRVEAGFGSTGLAASDLYRPAYGDDGGMQQALTLEPEPEQAPQVDAVVPVSPMSVAVNAAMQPEPEAEPVAYAARSTPSFRSAASKVLVTSSLATSAAVGGGTAGAAVKNAVKEVQAGLKLEKQAGREFDALVQLMQASRRSNLLADDINTNEKQRSVLRKNAAKADASVVKLMQSLPPEQVEAATAMFEPQQDQPQGSTDPNGSERLESPPVKAFSNEEFARKSFESIDKDRTGSISHQPQPAIFEQEEQLPQSLDGPRVIEATDTDDDDLSTEATSPARFADESPSATNSVEVQQLRSELQRTADALRRSEDSLAAAKDAARRAEDRAATLQRQEKSTQIEIEDLRARNERLSQDLRSQSSISPLDTGAGASQDEVDRQRRRADDAEAAVARVKREKDQALDELQHVSSRAAQAREESEGQIKRLREQLAEATSGVEERKLRMASLGSQDALKGELATAQSELAAAQREVVSARLQSQQEADAELRTVRQQLTTTESASESELSRAKLEKDRYAIQEETRFKTMRQDYDTEIRLQAEEYEQKRQQLQAQLSELSGTGSPLAHVDSSPEIPQLRLRLEQAQAEAARAESEKKMLQDRLDAAASEMSSLRVEHQHQLQLLQQQAPVPRPSVEVSNTAELREAEEKLAQAVQSGNDAAQRERENAARAGEVAARALSKCKGELSRAREEVETQEEARDADRKEIRRLKSALSESSSLEEELRGRMTTAKREATAALQEASEHGEAEARRTKQALTAAEEEVESMRMKLRSTKDELERERTRARTKQQDLEHEIQRERASASQALAAANSVAARQPIMPMSAGPVVMPQQQVYSRSLPPQQQQPQQPPQPQVMEAVPPTAQSDATSTKLTAEIRSLATLREEGVITEEEFAQGKTTILVSAGRAGLRSSAQQQQSRTQRTAVLSTGHYHNHSRDYARQQQQHQHQQQQQQQQQQQRQQPAPPLTQQQQWLLSRQQQQDEALSQPHMQMQPPTPTQAAFAVPRRGRAPKSPRTPYGAMQGGGGIGEELPYGGHGSWVSGYESSFAAAPAPATSTALHGAGGSLGYEDLLRLKRPR
jgi:hypothetical protein